MIYICPTVSRLANQHHQECCRNNCWKYLHHGWCWHYENVSWNEFFFEIVLCIIIVCWLAGWLVVVSHIWSVVICFLLADVSHSSLTKPSNCILSTQRLAFLFIILMSILERRPMASIGTLPCWWTLFIL